MRTTLSQSLNELLDVNKKKPANFTDEQREKFLGICPICKQPVKYLSGNIVACANDQCEGYTAKDFSGNPVRIPYYRLLTGKSAKYAKKLFSKE